MGRSILSCGLVESMQNGAETMVSWAPHHVILETALQMYCPPFRDDSLIPKKLGEKCLTHHSGEVEGRRLLVGDKLRLEERKWKGVKRMQAETREQPRQASRWGDGRFAGPRGDTCNMQSART